MSYEKVNWKNYPDKSTLISAENLNHMDDGIKKLDDEKLNIDKITQSTAVNQDGYALDAREKNASISGTMANQISALNTNLVAATTITTSGKITWTSDTFFTAYGNQRLIKIGKLCFLHLCFAIKNTISAGGVVCGLPQGFTPKTNITNYAIITDSSRGPVAFDIKSNGQVVSRTTVDSCNVEINCAYETA